MIKTFTQNDIIRYLYKEMPLHESVAFEEAMDTDEELQMEYLKFDSVIKAIDQERLSASVDIIDKIKQRIKNK